MYNIIMDNFFKNIVQREISMEISLLWKDGKISLLENLPSLTNDSNVIQNTKKVTVVTLDSILIEFMDELKRCFNTNNVSYPYKKHIFFGYQDAINEFNVCYYIG